MTDDDGALVKDLYILVGNYETYTKNVDNKLDKIDRKMEKIGNGFIDVKLSVSTIEGRVDALEKNEDKALSRRRRLQLDGTMITAGIIALKEIAQMIIGFIR